MSNKRQPVDKVFLTLVLVELFFGFIMLTSASGPLSLGRFQSTWTYALHQLVGGIIPGLIGMWIFSRLDYRRWQRWAPQIFLAALALMVLVFIPGVSAGYGTANHWIMIGGFLSIQPVEVLKLAVILYLAALAANGRAPKETFIPSVLAFGACAVLLMLQPDMGSLIIVAAIFMIMIYSAGVPFAYLAGLAVAGGGASLAFAKSASYRAARLMVFLHPELDPQGIGYHINQAFLAVGSGGWFGLGLGNSQQKYSYLPEVMNDSIFPIIAEELGFFFALGLVVLIAVIFFRGLKIAKQTPDPFGRLVVIGVVSWLVVQSFLNIGAMIGLVPLTGVPLPLVSYGGTAMVMNLCSIGIVLSVSRGRG
jgi:cell division protein FtsW